MTAGLSHVRSRVGSSVYFVRSEKCVFTDLIFTFPEPVPLSLISAHELERVLRHCYARLIAPKLVIINLTLGPLRPNSMANLITCSRFRCTVNLALECQVKAVVPPVSNAIFSLNCFSDASGCTLF